MNTRGTLLSVAAAVLLLVPACALHKGPPDPAKVERKMAATLDGEKELIRSKVGSPERADRLIALLDDRDRLVAEQAQRVSAYRDRVKALNADYGAGRDSFEEAVAAYNKDRLEWQRHFVELIDAMKKEATADEWKAIARYQLKKLNPRETSYEPAGGGH